MSVIRLVDASEIAPQLGFFTDLGREKKEIDLVKATLSLQKRFGKSAVFKAYDLLDGANILERNQLIGGHRA